MHDLPVAPASRLPQAEAAGPSSLLRNGQDHAATSAQGFVSLRLQIQNVGLFGLHLTSET
jgi:hypothetical protein